VPTAKIAVSAINTVTDLRFHSHRRDRQNAGRGLGFFCV
jgi:copper oxidase (laccase) domain-containing protein